jgi:pyruvate-ferredoxin/flavodoxin oxidoreductase
MIEEKYVIEHRQRALSPDHPVLRGTAQNPDVYFQGRETVNPFYAATPAIVQKYMDKFAKITGREYGICEYYGAKDAENIIVIMCSGAETAEETALYLNKKGEKVGVLNVRLFRPFPTEAFLKALPATVKKIAVLDRTKEPGGAGEPLTRMLLPPLTKASLMGRLPSKLLRSLPAAATAFLPRNLHRPWSRVFLMN